MSQNIRLKRSSVPGRVPTVSQLDLGELALNTNDGKLYLKQDVGGIQSVITVGESSSFAISSSYALTASYWSGSVSNAESASYALTASYFSGSIPSAQSASYALTASYSNNSTSASFALTASYAANVGSGISSSLSGSIGYLPVFVGPNTLNNSIAYQGLRGIGINTDSFNAAHEALRVYQPDTSSFNIIQAVGNTNNYLQINIKNDSLGTSASSDIVATAGNGNENTLYIDMGINGPGYNVENSVGSGNDAYLYSTGNKLLIGNASENQSVYIFAGGIDESANQKLVLSYDNNHQLTGSLNVSGSLVVNNTITAQTLIVQTITSSVEFITGSTRFGTLMSNTHQFTGSVLVTGSIVVSGSVYGNTFFGDGAYLTNIGYIEKVFYVAEDGNDSNDGKTLNTSFRTIKAASIAASASIAAAPPASVPYRMTIRVEPGYYSEQAPITVPSNVSIIGNDLRTVVVRPTTSTSGSNLFLVNNGDYFYGLRLEGCVIDNLEDPRNGFFFAFAPGAYISTSPYIQNCSAINTPFDKFYVPLDSGSANPLVGNGPGGMIVDDSVLNGYSPLKSMIVDAYTQVAFNGIGICVRGRGYAQMVSFFTNFSRIGTYCIDGGHASLLNSNTTFGDYGLRSKGLRLLVVPDISDISSSINPNGYTLLKQYKSNIQNYMISQLSVSGSYNTSYISGSGQYYASTITDSGLLIDAIADDLLSPKSSRLSQFIQGLFKAQDISSGSIYTLPIASGSSFTKGVVTVIPQISNPSGSLTGDFIKSWQYMRNYIQNDPDNLFTIIGTGGKEKIEQSFNKVIDTITSIVVNAAGAQYIQEFGSLITSTSHDFSYAGSGVNFLALPVNQGGIGETNFDLRVVEEDGGRVYYTAGDETGDFYVGNDFIIRLATGTIEGRTFYKSVSAQITPLNLALETYS
jgi:hypothetical protein